MSAISDFLARANEQFFTKAEVAEALAKWLKERLPAGATEWLEPAAGKGTIAEHFPGARQMDISPQGPGIEAADYLKTPLPYKEGRVTVTNPPFGDKGSLAREFLAKSLEEGDYAGMILPRSFARTEVGGTMQGGRLMDQALIRPNAFTFPSGNPTPPVKTVAQLWQRELGAVPPPVPPAGSGPVRYVGDPGIVPEYYNTAINRNTGKIGVPSDVTNTNWYVGKFSPQERAMLEQHLDPAILQELSTGRRGIVTIDDVKRALRGEKRDLPPYLWGLAGAAAGTAVLTPQDAAAAGIGGAATPAAPPTEAAPNPFLATIAEKIRQGRAIAKSLSDAPISAGRPAGILNPSQLGFLADLALPGENITNWMEEKSKGQTKERTGGEKAELTLEALGLPGAGAVLKGLTGAGLATISAAKGIGWDINKAIQAEDMWKKGASIWDIWKQLKLDKEPQTGKWFEEISDAPMKLTPLGRNLVEYTSRTGSTSPYAEAKQLIEHPELYAKQPEAGLTNVKFSADPAGSKGMWLIDAPTQMAAGRPFNKLTELELTVHPGAATALGHNALSPEHLALNQFIHEIIHPIQAKEGLQMGGSSSHFYPSTDYPVIKQTYDTALAVGLFQVGDRDERMLKAILDRAALTENKTPFQAYFGLPGEAGARAGQRRMFLDPAVAADRPYTKSYGMEPHELTPLEGWPWPMPALPTP